jgi:hypothetical protein
MGTQSYAIFAKLKYCAYCIKTPFPSSIPFYVRTHTPLAGGYQLTVTYAQFSKTGLHIVADGRLFTGKLMMQGTLIEELDFPLVEKTSDFP